MIKEIQSNNKNTMNQQINTALNKINIKLDKLIDGQISNHHHIVENNDAIEYLTSESINHFYRDGQPT